MHLPRNVLPKIKSLLEQFPVVVILGVRQCGKSTLAKVGTEQWQYFDMEKPADFDLINNDPWLFFKENDQHVIIDEAQKYPELFSVLRSVIDERRQQNGRFILTGSSSFELIKNISESLAGRVALVELSPFKMNEISSQPLSDFYSIFENKLSIADLELLKNLTPEIDFKTLKQNLLRGGYPQPALSASPQFQMHWMENYFDTYINRDMRSLFPKMNLINYRRLIKMLSSLSGTIINKAEIGRSIDTSEKTVRDYLQMITGTFFWRELPAFKTSKIKTTVSTPKGHYRDCGLLLFLQNVFTLEELNLYPKLGNVFEGFIVEEIIRGVEAGNAVNLQPYHFRTRNGGEIDLILEGSFGLLPIEIKYQSHTKSKQLKAMTNFIELHEIPYGIVINNCDKPAMITERIIQIPAGCL